MKQDLPQNLPLSPAALFLSRSLTRWGLPGRQLLIFPSITCEDFYRKYQYWKVSVGDFCETGTVVSLSGTEGERCWSLDWTNVRDCMFAAHVKRGGRRGPERLHLLW